ncbi:hypothetical protein V7793_06305 [Streptomyces sp. KLMMK]|uniref:hypothetical protein n=1 Tax=Streptomyces sp. KLMMK TaxID=3109353 RepID=UPI002FFF8F44
MDGKGTCERGGCGLGRPFTPPLIVAQRLTWDLAALYEKRGQGLRLGGVQGHGDQRRPELVDAGRVMPCAVSA